MAGTRSTNTMSEGLPALMSLLQELKLAPDADLPWLIQLETQIIQKVQSQYGASDQAAQMAAPPGNATPSPLDALPPGMGGGMPPGVGGGMPTGVGGGVPMQGTNSGVGGSRMPTPMPAPPNPDELRRLMNPGPQGG